MVGSSGRGDLLPFHVPEIGEEEIAEISEAIRSGWLTTGPKVKEFERGVAAYVGANHAVALNSATAAVAEPARDLPACVQMAAVSAV